MNILNYFGKEKINATIVTLTQAPGADGIWGDSKTEGATIRGVKYNLSTSSSYRNVTWTGTVTDVFVTDNSTVGKDDLLRINGIDYNCEFPDNVGEQNEAYLIGLRRAV